MRSATPRRLRCSSPCAFGLLGALAFVACGTNDRAKPSEGSAGASSHAGKQSTSGGKSGGTSEGGEPSATPGGVGNSVANGGEPAGGAPPLGAGGDLTEHPPNVGGDPGIMLEPCPNEDATQPAGFTGVCNAANAWGQGDDVPVQSGEARSFVAITPSELTLVWSEAQSAVAVYFLADRAAARETFGEAQELPYGRVLGLSPDGLRLTLLDSDGNLAEASRSQADDSFGDAGPGAYATLVADAKSRHLALGDIAISPDDLTLYYTAWSLQDATTYPVQVSVRSSGGLWSIGSALQGCELKAFGAFGPRPTAVSADGLTLFYFDGARSTARAAFRKTTQLDFSWFVDLPDTLRPQPNAACDKLYYSPGQGLPRLLSAARTP